MSKDVEKIVRYDNTFNKTSLSVLTKIQSDILMSVLEKMGKEVEIDEKGNRCYIARYEFKEIRDLIDSKNMQAHKIKKVFDELLNTKVEFFGDGIYTKANLFSSYSLTNRSTAEIVLSSQLTSKMVIGENNYTILQLEEYVSLKNKYSKELYRLLRQFRHSGLLIIKREDLLNILKPPKSYDEYNFIQKALNPAIEDNKEYFEGLKLTNFERNGNALPPVCKFSFKKHEKAKNLLTINESENEEKDLLEYIMNNGGMEWNFKVKGGLHVEIFKKFSREDISEWNERVYNLISGVNYYVYFHYLDGELFYIGKGTKERCFEMSRRSERWISYVNGRESDVIVDIVKTFHEEDEAFNYERFQIARNRNKNLTNLILYENSDYKERGKVRKKRKQVSSSHNKKRALERKSKEKVYFNSQFNFNILLSLSEIQKDVFLFLLSLEGLEVKFTMSELRFAIYKPSLQAVRVKKAIVELKEKGLISWYSFNGKEINVKIDEELSNDFYSSSKNSFFYLEEFSSLKGHSKGLYLEFSKKRSSNMLKINKKKLLESFLIPESYCENYFIKRILLPSIEEVSEHLGGISLLGYEDGESYLPELCKLKINKKKGS